MALPLKSREECGFDAVSLGEVMLRLDPGEGRIRTSREFHASVSYTHLTLPTILLV